MVPSSTLLVALGLWCFIGAFGANLATIMNGLGLLKFQAITGCIMALTNIIVSIYLVGAIGSSGVVYGSVISLVVMSYVPSYIYVKYYLDSLPAERVPATTVKV